MKTIATYKGHEIQMNSKSQVVCDDLTVLRSFCYSQIALKKGTPVLQKGEAARIAAAIKAGTYDAKPDVSALPEQDPHAMDGGRFEVTMEEAVIAEVTKPESVIMPAPTASEPMVASPEKAKHVKMSYGQCGPALDLTVDELTDKEKAVMAVLGEEAVSIASLASAAFPQLSPVQANSWVRNSLRRLVRARFVRRVSEGQYATAVVD
jgi:hypothetical protein